MTQTNIADIDEEIAELEATVAKLKEKRAEAQIDPNSPPSQAEGFAQTLFDAPVGNFVWHQDYCVFITREGITGSRYLVMNAKRGSFAFFIESNSVAKHIFGRGSLDG